MPAKSAAQTLLDKADKKATSSGGWFTSSSTKFEEAGDLYQQAANSFKIDKLFKEAGDAFARDFGLAAVVPAELPPRAPSGI